MLRYEATQGKDKPVHRENKPRAASIYFGCRPSLCGEASVGRQPTLQEACVVHNASFRSVAYAVISVFFYIPFLRSIRAEASAICGFHSARTRKMENGPTFLNYTHSVYRLHYCWNVNVTTVILPDHDN